MIRDLRVQFVHRTLLAGSIGAISLVAWVLLWRYGAALHSPAHHHHGGAASPSALLFVSSWTVMTLAMMLPTTVPLVAIFHTIVGQRPDRPALIALLVLGYVGIWTATGLIFYGAGTAVHQALAANVWLQARPQLWSGLILLAAGSYQFTPLKHRCLERCRSPLSFVLGYWQGTHNHRNAFRLGAHHGLFCVGCCWALMLLMFVVGAGQLAWMLVLGATMAIEKNVSWGPRLSTPLGTVLTVSGLGILASLA